MKITTLFNETYNQNRIDYIKTFIPEFKALEDFQKIVFNASVFSQLYELYNLYLENKEATKPFLFVTFKGNNMKFSCINFTMDAFTELVYIGQKQEIEEIRIVF
jgi:hypothetical protein